MPLHAPFISLLPERYDVSAVHGELLKYPSVWGEHKWRTESPTSPHREASDVWLRYNSLKNLGPKFNDEHEAEWYPVCDLLPAAKQLALDVAQGEKLGGVLLTKIPAGKCIYPHADGGWHALEHRKIAVQIASHAHQAFCFKGECLSAKPGESYEFNNQVVHWVVNDSDEDRITMIVCIRRL